VIGSEAASPLSGYDEMLPLDPDVASGGASFAVAHLPSLALVIF
jgi:hypothetical protein